MFIYQFNNFHLGEIWIYSATFTEMFVQIRKFSWEIKKTKVDIFLLKHTVLPD